MEIDSRMGLFVIIGMFEEKFLQNIFQISWWDWQKGMGSFNSPKQKSELRTDFWNPFLDWSEFFKGPTKKKRNDPERITFEVTAMVKKKSKQKNLHPREW